jgi:hypothetical protein
MTLLVTDAEFGKALEAPATSTPQSPPLERAQPPRTRRAISVS